MGQYYYVVNIDKREFFKPDSLKLMETSYVGNPVPENVVSFLKGKWNGDRVIWAGDYAEQEKYIDSFIEELSEHKIKEIIQYSFNYREIDIITKYGDYKTFAKYILNFHFLTKHMFKEIHPDFSKVIKRKNTTVLLLNEDKKQVVKVPKFNEKELVIHPLPLLVCSTYSNSGGGYHSEKDREYVGYWSGDELSTFIVKDNIVDSTLKDISDEYEILNINFEE